MGKRQILVHSRIVQVVGGLNVGGARSIAQTGQLQTQIKHADHCRNSPFRNILNWEATAVNRCQTPLQIIHWSCYLTRVLTSYGNPMHRRNISKGCLSNNSFIGSSPAARMSREFSHVAYRVLS